MSAWSEANDSGNLLAGHRYADGTSWGYIATGLVENNATTANAFTPELIAEIFATFGDDLRSVAQAESIPIELLVAAIALVAESVGTAASVHHIQYLDGFSSDDETPELAYVGCTGLRFDRVRVLLGSVTIANYVDDPLTAITAAAQHMLASIGETQFQPPMVASAYNAVGVRFDAASRWRLINPQQIDRFLGWFNAAIFAVITNITLAGTAPSFTAALATLGPAIPLPPATTTSQSQQYFKPESQAAIDAGMMTLCESNPNLSTIWALDNVTTTQITNLALGVGAGQGLPMGLPAFAYPDRNRVMRTMTPDEIQQLYRCMRDYITAIILYDTGHLPSLPGQPVFMA